jgi:hypothetical protein
MLGRSGKIHSTQGNRVHCLTITAHASILIIPITPKTVKLLLINYIIKSILSN